MQRSYQYLFLSISLFFVLLSFYFSFDIYVNGSDFDKKQIQFLSMKLEQSQFEKELIAEGVSAPKARGIASISLSTKSDFKVLKERPVEFSEFYFIRIEDLKSEGKTEAALKMISEVKDKSTSTEYLSRADYEYLSIRCDQGKIKDTCVETVDRMVSQYPYSEWTGLALVWLSKTYSRVNRVEDSQKIVSILKKDFSDSVRISQYINSLDKSNSKKVE